MTKNQVNDLTPEEQAELTENMPMLLEALEKGSPVAPAWLANWRSKRGIAEEAREQAAEIQKAVAAAMEAAGPEQASLAQWCGFPTDMTRCSPFFPIHSSLLGHRDFLRDFLITAASWGEILYTGPKRIQAGSRSRGAEDLFLQRPGAASVAFAWICQTRERCLQKAYLFARIADVLSRQVIHFDREDEKRQEAPTPAHLSGKHAFWRPLG